MSAVVALVSMFVEPLHLDGVLSALARIDSVKESYEVTGEFDIVSIISVSVIKKFRGVLKNGIMKIAGVKGTVTSIILNPSKN